MINGIRRFARERSGNMALLAGIAMIPLMLSVGLGIDYARYSSAHHHLQEMADAAALAVVASRSRDEAALRQQALEHLRANNRLERATDLAIHHISIRDDRVELQVSGSIHASFLSLAGYDRLGVATTAVAERAVRGNVEVALILDNTYSMSATDAGGRTRIALLKTAAAKLVREVLDQSDGSARIGIVPYAEYMNVGTQHRNAWWLSVPADYTVAGTPQTCETRTTRNECVRSAPTYSCTTWHDGIPQNSTCGGGCQESRTVTVPPYQHCWGGSSAQNYRWYGCVGSRTAGNARLQVGRPDVRYPGYVETRQNCLSAIVPLTTNRNTLLNAVDGMVSHVGSYRPYTYIPSGLIWGYNLLTPGEPFAGAAAFDPENYRPRKVAVLMTDGQNTLAFNASNGRHERPGGNEAAQANQLRKTDEDAMAICTAMKGDGIEIFTVSFMVDDQNARNLLRGCATSAQHHHDASNPDQLLAAFGEITRSLTVVRLTR